MKQLNQFKVGQEVITKFPVEINLDDNHDKVEIIITEYLRPCGFNGCSTCGDSFEWKPMGFYINKNQLKNLQLVPKITNGELKYHLKLVVTQVEKSTGQFQNLKFADSLVDWRGNILTYNHFAFIKF